MNETDVASITINFNNGPIDSMSTRIQSKEQKSTKCSNENSIESSKRRMKSNALEMIIAIAILFLRIATDHRDASEYFDKAKEANACKMNDADNVDAGEKSLKGIVENAGEFPSTCPSESDEIEEAIIKQQINSNTSTFVTAMTFAQTEKLSNKWLSMSNESCNLNSKNEIIYANKACFRSEMNYYEINQIEVHEGAICDKAQLSNECHDENTTILKSNQLCYDFGYDSPFKDKHKHRFLIQMISESQSICIKSVHQYLMIALIAFLLLKTMMDLKVLDFNSEDEDAHQKKVYDDTSHCTDIAEHTKSIAAKNTTHAGTKHLGSRSIQNKTKVLKRIAIKEKATNQTSSKMAQFSQYATKQTIATNEGVLECGVLPPK